MTDLKATILCVDDEEPVLTGLRLQLRREHDVLIAHGPEAALEVLEDLSQPLAVVLTDMRMPGMDGAELLARAAALRPDTTRMLLTGHADLDAAVRAINQGGAFRFLVKPCRGEPLRDAIREGVELHQLKRAEAELLEQTLSGCVDALTEVLALAEPMAFGRVRRIDEVLGALRREIDIEEGWALEVANAFAHLPSVTLPPAVLEKLHHGHPLDAAEARMVSALPKLSQQLAERIPRLGPVVAILEDAARERPRSLAGAAYRVARDYVELVDAGRDPQLAAAVIAGREGLDRQVTAALARMVGAPEGGAGVREVRIAQLRPGMIFAQDVRDGAGRLLIGRGQLVSDTLRRRLQNLGPDRVPERVLVQAPDADAA